VGARATCTGPAGTVGASPGRGATAGVPAGSAWRGRLAILLLPINCAGVLPFSLSSILPEVNFRLPEICKTPSAASKQQVINISCQQYTGATGPQSRHRLNQGTAHRIYGSVRAEQACDGTTTTRRTQCGLGCAAGCGGWAGSDTCFTHRFAALSALLPHGRFARCAPHAAIAAALAQQYLPCRPHGINAIRPVEMAVGPV
jgi:hypothetical protein